MFDALTNMFEGKNINRRMTLRNQLKGVKIQKIETIKSYFSRVSHIKEQLESIGDMIEEQEVVMATLNGLPREWDSFIRGICARSKLTKSQQTMGRMCTRIRKDNQQRREDK